MMQTTIGYGEEPMRGRDRFHKYKGAIYALSIVYGWLPRRTRIGLMSRLRKVSGNLAMAKRYALAKSLSNGVGENVAIFTDVYLQNIERLTIGDNVSIHPMSYIEAYGGVTIGNDVSIAEGASIFSVNHSYDALDIPIKDQGLTPLPIVIEDNVWIGAKATILGGVKVSSGTIVAAGAVVTKDTACNTIVAGVPAKEIRHRL